ncbi:MAG: tight adherence protein [Candidatus Eremiobacteraeota bacterium]|jgi:tight adherence protein B|nr:tight adherence protein [Candidatus Eremiobacteraeota bacterium]
MDPTLLIIAGVTAVVGLLGYTFAGSLTGAVRERLTSVERLARAGNVDVDVKKLVLVSYTSAAAAAALAILLLRPSVLVAVGIVAAAAAAGYFGLRRVVKSKAAGRRKRFLPQLEMALRMMSSSLRVGLGLRQAVVIVTEELEDPARHEFVRVIGRTNIGISILDAIDEVADRMPSSEMMMSARAIRIQSKTGGDLAKVLEGVADTIRARRGLVAKMQSLTAEGRASGLIILALPLVIGAFIMLTQPAMAHSLFTTRIGLSALGLVAALEFAAGISLNKIMSFDV